MRFSLQNVVHFWSNEDETVPGRGKEEGERSGMNTARIYAIQPSKKKWTHAFVSYQLNNQYSHEDTSFAVNSASLIAIHLSNANE